MPIPDFQTLMYPALKATEDGREHALADLRNALAKQFQLTPDERAERLPSGKQPTFDNRVGWTTTYLRKAKLLEAPRRGRIRITDRGRQVIQECGGRLDLKYLSRFERSDAGARLSAVLACLVLLLASPAHGAPPPAPPVVVVARLLDAGPRVPHCGGLHVVVVMRYAVVRVLEGQLDAGEIAVVQSCPEMALVDGAGKVARFRVGDVHRLTLRRERPAGWPGAVNRDDWKALPRYYASRSVLEAAARRP